MGLGPGLPGAPSLFAGRPSRAGQPLTVSTDPVLNFVFVFDLLSLKSEFCRLHLVPQASCSLVLFSEPVNAVFTGGFLQPFPSIVPESHSVFLCSWNSFIFTAAHNYTLLTPHSSSVLVSMLFGQFPVSPALMMILAPFCTHVQERLRCGCTWGEGELLGPGTTRQLYERKPPLSQSILVSTAEASGTDCTEPPTRGNVERSGCRRRRLVV